MIPVAKPKLPDVKALTPYLEQIDQNRYYSNFGPLVKSLEERFPKWIGAPEGGVLTTSNGTAALELVITALGLPRGAYVITPSWTFSATAHAILNSWLQPFFVDVDPGSWAMTPDIAREALQNCPGDVALVLTVAPFGLPPDVKAWEAFYDETDLPVVIDAAAVLPTEISVSGKVISTMSLHATKVLNAGEGGLVLCDDPSFILRSRELSNFDLREGGIAQHTGNKKMSEYHAAVAHASIDDWDEIERDFMRVAKRYADNFADNNDVGLRPGYGEERFNATCIVETRASVSAARMAELGVMVRHGWRMGCHKEPLFESFPRMDLPVTEELAPRVTGLPCYRDMRDEEIDFVCEMLMKHLSEGA